MSFPRFFSPLPLVSGQELALADSAAAHAARALRLAPGATITLFDGSGGEYRARLRSVSKEAVSALVEEFIASERESPLSVRLAQALQAGDKMDFTVQKAVELGVAEIQPLASQRSVVRLTGERAARRTEHWQKVAQAACEQCGRNRVPRVMPLMALANWLAAPAPPRLRLLLAPDGEVALRDLAPAAQIDLLIGAEGGLHPDEAAQARAAGFIGVRLGPRILRTETAALATLAALQALWGDFAATGGSNV